MRVKYIVRENGKFDVKDEKFLPPIRTFDSLEEAKGYLKEQYLEVTEKFEVQVQQENGEFRLLDMSTDIENVSSQISEEETPIVEPTTQEEATPVAEPTTPEEATPVAEPTTPEEATPMVSPETKVVEDEKIVTTATADPIVTTATAVQPVAEQKESEETKMEETPETSTTMNVDKKEDTSKKTKHKFDIKDLWKNPEYRKWLYLGIAVVIEVAIIIAIIVLIAQ